MVRIVQAGTVIGETVPGISKERQLKIARLMVKEQVETTGLGRSRK